MPLPFRQTKRFGFHIVSRFLILFLVAFIVVFGVISSLFIQQLEDEITHISIQKLNAMSSELTHSVSEVRDFYYDLVHDQQLQYFMRGYTADMANAQDHAVTQSKRDFYSEELRRRLSQLMDENNNVRSIVIVDNDGNVLDPLYSNPTESALLLQDCEYQKFLDCQLSARFSAPSNFPYRNTDASPANKTTISYSAVFYDEIGYRTWGTIVINLRKSALQNVMEPLLSTGFDYVYLADEANEVIIQSDSCPAEIPAAVQQASIREDNTLQDGVRVFTISVPDYPRWRIVAVSAHKTALAPVQNIMIVTLLVAIVVFFIVWFTGNRITEKATTPLRELAEAMPTSLEKSWSTLTNNTTTDELGRIVIGYQDMAHTLQEMENTIREEQKSKRAYEVQMLQTRLDLLQSQINPHFIHNTLNTMNYMAMKEGAKDLSRLIVSFNGLLRSSMSTNHMFNAVADEVENLKRYLVIQQARYDMYIRCVYNVTDEAQLVPIPKLILQPLVENALFHGIVPQDGGTIVVHAAVADDRLWVSVVDNGCGMSEAQLNKLLTQDSSNARGYNSIGVRNVNDRLKLSYGDASHMVVQSAPNMGTTISFSVPVHHTPQ